MMPFLHFLAYLQMRILNTSDLKYINKIINTILTFHHFPSHPHIYSWFEFNQEEKYKYVCGACFANGYIVIYGKENDNISQIITLFHEFGHSILLNADTNKSIIGLDYNIPYQQQKYIKMKEELFAWIKGYQLINRLNIKWYKKIILKSLLILISFRSLSCYLLSILNFGRQ